MVAREGWWTEQPFSRREQSECTQWLLILNCLDKSSSWRAGFKSDVICKRDEFIECLFLSDSFKKIAKKKKNGSNVFSSRGFMQGRAKQHIAYGYEMENEFMFCCCYSFVFLKQSFKLGQLGTKNLFLRWLAIAKPTLNIARKQRIGRR